MSVIAPYFLWKIIYFWGGIDAESLKCFLAVIYDMFYACFSYLLYVMCLWDSDHTLWWDKLRRSFVDVYMLTTPCDGTNWVGLLMMWYMYHTLCWDKSSWLHLMIDDVYDLLFGICAYWWLTWNMLFVVFQLSQQLLFNILSYCVWLVSNLWHLTNFMLTCFSIVFRYFKS